MVVGPFGPWEGVWAAGRSADRTRRPAPTEPQPLRRTNPSDRLSFAFVRSGAARGWEAGPHTDPRPFPSFPRSAWGCRPCRSAALRWEDLGSEAQGIEEGIPTQSEGTRGRRAPARQSSPGVSRYGLPVL
jgi:hypothetical protein